MTGAAASPFYVLAPGSPKPVFRGELGATQAWAWARQHPASYYRQAELNQHF